MTFTIRLFFDGACPVCQREMGLLRKLDRRKRLRFVDISAPDFREDAWGRDWNALMARMHGQLPDGTWVEGVEVFRHAYGAVGFGPLIWLTRLPGVSQLLDWGYVRFAVRRLRFTGRCDAACHVSTLDAPAE